MNWQRTTSGFILGTIGVIFSYDFIAFVFGSHATISEQVTNWIDVDLTHLIIFLALVVTLCIHFIWGFYKKD